MTVPGTWPRRPSWWWTGWAAASPPPAPSPRRSRATAAGSRSHPAYSRTPVLNRSIGTGTAGPVLWIRMFLGFPDPDPLVRGTEPERGSFYHQAKIARKPFIPTVLWLLDDFLFLKMTQIYLQKVISKKTLKYTYNLSHLYASYLP